MKNNIKITVLHSGTEEDALLARPIVNGLTRLNAAFPDSVHIWVTEQLSSTSPTLSGLQLGREDGAVIQEFLRASDIIIVLLSSNLVSQHNEYVSRLSEIIEDTFMLVVGREGRKQPTKQAQKVFAAQIAPSLQLPGHPPPPIFGQIVEDLFWWNKALKWYSEVERESLVQEFIGKVYEHIIKSREECIRIAIPAWVGYLSGILANGGLKLDKDSQFFKENRFGVEFVIMDDFDQAIKDWKDGKIHLTWATPDLLARNWTAIKPWEPTIVYQADWSRGADCLLVRPGIETVADLRGKNIVITENGPGEALLRAILRNNGIGDSEINFVSSSTDPNLTIKNFIKDKGQNFHGIVTATPFDQILMKYDGGLRELFSTASPGFEECIADVLIGNRTFCETHLEELDAIFSQWFAETAKLAAAKEAKGALVAEAVGKLVEELLDPIPAIVPDEVREQIAGQLRGYFLASLEKIELAGAGENNDFLLNGRGEAMIQLFSELFPAESKPSWSEMYLTRKLAAVAA